MFANPVHAYTPSNANELELKGNEIAVIMRKLEPRTGVEVDPRTKVEGE